MIRPEIKSDGSNNWSKIDWDDVDIGEYTNLCPDKNRSDFEYGSTLIVNEAMRGPIHKMFEPQKLSSSKIKRELGQIISALDRLSPDTRMYLHIMSRFTEPVDEIKNFMQRGIDRSPTDKAKGSDEAKNTLASDAWSIWADHGGDIHSSEFLEYVERLLDNANFINETGKSRVNVNNLVLQIRQASNLKSPLPWSLWG